MSATAAAIQSDPPEYPLHVLVAQTIADEYEDGDLIPMDWLRAAMQIEEPDLEELTDIPQQQWFDVVSDLFKTHQFDWLEAMDNLRTELLETHQIALRNIRGQGYMRLPPREQASEAINLYARDMTRAYRKAHSLVINVRFDHLDEHQRREAIETRNKLEAMRKLNAERINRQSKAEI